jgi:hypothetical protein
METPRCSLDAALPVVENLQKYRYILENIDGVFIDYSWFVPNFAQHINWYRLRSLLAIYLFRRLVYFIKEYLATPWRVAVKYCHFLGRHVTGPSCLASSSHWSPRIEVDWTGLKLNIPFDTCFVPEDIDASLSKWCDLFLSIVHDHTPKCSSRNVYDHPWVDKGLLELIKKKNKQRKKLLRTKHPDD